MSNKIRQLRFNRGEMTQQELAKKVGASRQTINNVESGKYCPSLELAFLIAEALDSSIEDVFAHEKDEVEK
ncbi:helix-turn-helix transcriptional regulator [Fusibacter sp. A1]|uniref:helix-turn-helix transcriptional regulator n=1 Tax=Fusibacter sp. A2 TaxID=2929473 RepID=UPI0019D70764|nr:helix-turn-helix transcriptional regulator [Fusibacter sp. A1]